MASRHGLGWGLCALTLGFATGAASGAIPTNPLLWVRADAGAEVSSGVPAGNGDPVNIWQDQGPSNHDMTPSTVFFNAPPSAAAPTYVANQINGKPALSFALPNNSLQSDAALVTGPSSLNFTVISVVKVGSSGERVIGGNYGAANGGGIELYAFDPDNVGPIGNVATYYHGAEYARGARDIAQQWVYIEFERRSGGTSQTRVIRVNNVVDGTYDELTTGTGQVPGNLNWTIGSGADYNTSAAMGLIAEQLVYTRSLNASEREDLRAYMLEKYGLIPEPSMAVAALALIGITVRQRRSHAR